MLELVLSQRPLARCAPLDGVALLDADGELTYRELARRIEARARELDLPARSVVVLEGQRSIELVVTYLALLWSGQVPLLAARGGGELAEHWGAAAHVTISRHGLRVRRLDGASPALHPDLALLLPTSGSTGSPKLVRLSARNLSANAASIATYLGVNAEDRAISSLPLHYCYGLSVLHAHLHAGASMVVTESSVVDPCFRELYTSRGVTNLAGVPYTFELLERADDSWLGTPSLRLLTQAGGRLPAEQVRRWAQRARGWGAELFVMYGQTEATARIAYLSPALVERRPAAIGRAIPGGTLRLRTAAGDVLEGATLTDGAEGELLYRGPNVMLGYAHHPADLALGATVDELATGDLARYHADDAVFEIVGRAARFTKLFGLRIDLDAVEAMVRPLAAGAVAALGDDDRLRIAAPGSDAARLYDHVATGLGLPPVTVEVRADADIVRTDAGKIDYAATARHWPAPDPACPQASAGSAERAATPDPRVERSTQVARIVAAVLGRRHVDIDRSFVALGGDSLSYVECSLRLESLLGPLPADWHQVPLRHLVGRRDDPAPGRPARPRCTASMDTSIVLRATAICMVVSYHMGVVRSPGGAHLMLALAGYNFARFLADLASPVARLRAAARTCARVATPAVLWLGAGYLLFGLYELPMVLLVHNYAGSPDTFFEGTWAYWFFEVFVHLTMAVALLLAVPAVDRLHRRAPYALPLVLFLVALAVRSWWRLPGEWHFAFYRTHSVAFFFFLGWLVHRSDTLRLRLLTTALALVSVPGFFGSPRKELAVVAGVALLVWWRAVPVPRVVVRPASVLAAASLWIYLTHFELWPRLAAALDSRVLAYVPTILAGVAAWRLQRAALAAWAGASARAPVHVDRSKPGKRDVVAAG